MKTRIYDYAVNIALCAISCAFSTNLRLLDALISFIVGLCPNFIAEEFYPARANPIWESLIESVIAALIGLTLSYALANPPLLAALALSLIASFTAKVLIKFAKKILN